MGFPKDFMWGAASAAIQVEGGFDADGKGPGIWDVAAKMPGKVQFQETGDVSCDHYHHFKEDVALMKEIGLKYYRLSISWPRVLPEGTGKVNEAGIAFYSQLVDELLAAGITPMVTLFHWNYPLALHHKGGWMNDESPDWFAEYVQVVTDRLSDRVSWWMTINEPQCFIGLGYQAGIHAPFEQHPVSEIARMSHNVLKAHGRAVQILRSRSKLPAKIGLAPTGGCKAPDFKPGISQSDAIEEARKASFRASREDFVFGNAWWADPIFLGDYPKEAYESLGNAMPSIRPGDLELIHQPLDFYGFNVYQTLADPAPRDQMPSNAYTGSPKTMMEWPVTPEALYWSPKFLYERYHLPILVTENGMAGMDWVCTDGKVHDPQRIDFITRYLREYKRAVDDGVEGLGYMYWSIMDNFEWACGYDKRFGLIHVDYPTQKRTIKDSGYWYRSVIESNGENL